MPDRRSWSLWAVSAAPRASTSLSTASSLGALIDVIGRSPSAGKIFSATYFSVLTSAR